MRYVAMMTVRSTGEELAVPYDAEDRDEVLDLIGEDFGDSVGVDYIQEDPDGQTALDWYQAEVDRAIMADWKAEGLEAEAMEAV